MTPAHPPLFVKQGNKRLHLFKKKKFNRCLLNNDRFISKTMSYLITIITEVSLIWNHSKSISLISEIIL